MPAATLGGHLNQWRRPQLPPTWPDCAIRVLWCIRSPPRPLGSAPPPPILQGSTGKRRLERRTGADNLPALRLLNVGIKESAVIFVFTTRCPTNDR